MLLQLVVISAIVYVILYYLNVRRYPKGPFPLPLIGNIHQIKLDTFHHQLHEYSKQYGPCFTVFLPRPTVVFADYETVKEALIQRDINHRAQLPPETLLQKELQTGILIADGEPWRIQRRAALRILREFGMGRNVMEEQVNRSIHELMEQLDKTNDGKTPFDMNLPLQLCVGNIINETLFGYHFKYNDTQKFEYFVAKLNKHLKTVKDNIFVFLMNAWPWMKSLPVVGQKGFHEPLHNISEYHDFIDEEINKASENYDPDHTPANFVHAYLKEMEKDPDAGLDMKNLNAIAIDFWLAGMETTSTSLRWALLFMMKHPQVQEKMREEIHAVVGKERQTVMTDKPQMPYFTAAIHEIQRKANMIPFLGTHRSAEATTIAGHIIPKDTVTMPQIWSVMREDPVFADTDTFRPERFLEDDGKTINKKALERNIVFSIGKRACVGEALARMELFLILATLLQKYRFEPTEPIDFTPVFSAVLVPRLYKCRIVPV